MLTWYAIKAAFKKAWLFLRHYGWIVIVGVALVAVAIIVYVAKYDGDTLESLWRVIKSERELHETKITEVNKIRDDEVEAVNSAGIRAIEAVKQAEEAFRDRSDELDAKKKKRIKKIVEQNRNDPPEAARQLAEQFGFIFVPVETP